MKTLLITVALVATLAGTHPAAAEPARTAIVSTAGLDLTTATGQRRLELRLLHAASDVCGTPSPADVRGRTRYQECRTQVRADAAGQVRLLAERAGAVTVAAR